MTIAKVSHLRGDVRGDVSASEGRARARGAACGAALDNITKSATPLEGICTDQHGVIIEKHDPLIKWELLAVARAALPGHRVNVCMRNVRESRREVDVRRSDKSGKPYYAGLMTCGSVWACPVCAAKIQAVRAAEVRSAIDRWITTGGTVVMVTQTVPHTRQDDLERLLRAFTAALSKFKAGSPYKRNCKALGITGSIRALEVTHGRNGWHPHAHTILFLRRCTSLKKIKDRLFTLWESATARAGFGFVSPSAFSVQDASGVKNYVTKLGTEYTWGAEHELVKLHSKTGSYDSKTPFDFLREHNWLERLGLENTGYYLALFAEYALTFHGRRQLVWSDGLKKQLLGSEGLTDEQVAASIGEADEVLASITLSDWRLIRKHNLQGHVLQIVNQYGATGLEHLLSVYR